MNLHIFEEIFENDLFQFTNNLINNLMQDFVLLILTEDCQDNLQYIQRKNVIDIIVVDEYYKSTNSESGHFFIICFDYLIILVEPSVFSLLYSFFMLNEESTIYCITPEIKSEIQNIFKGNTEINFHFSKENDTFFVNKEIPSFIKKCKLKLAQRKNDLNKKIQVFWPIVQKSVSGFLIKHAYINSEYDRCLYYEELFANSDQTDKQLEVKEDEYIVLQFFSVGCSSHLYLVFMIEKQIICLLKLFLFSENKEPLIYKRERDNYFNIHHPLLPRFFGSTEYNSCKGLLIEYIYGKTLNNVTKDELSVKEKIKIIMEIMIVFEYLHYNDYIYRDLKPNNIIIDKNNRAILIDFDRMIKMPENNSDEQNQVFTKDFTSTFCAPEIMKCNSISNKVDIYSIGKLIQYIMSDIKEFNEEFKKLIEQCTTLNPAERPNISELINVFYLDFFSKINEIKISDEIAHDMDYHGEYFFIFWFWITEYENNFIQIVFGLLYLDGFFIWKDMNQNVQYLSKSDFNPKDFNGDFKFISRNISKSIYYFSLAAGKNDSTAQTYLGYIYYKKECKSYDITKALYYFTQAAEKNSAKAQFYLGVIYYETEIVQDVNKAIYYLTLSANQNYKDALYYLGITFYKGEKIEKNIKKAIHYFLLAANQNDSSAQFYLGVIYYKGEYVSRDINKAIHYFTLSADQGDPDSQFNLGMIYHDGQFVMRDINKAIHYYSAAAEKNYTRSLYNLGTIYYQGQYVEQDVQKALYYFTRAANDNYSLAQHILGVIFYKGEVIPRDINKAIYYLTLSANQNISQAHYLLGMIFYEGLYIPRDMDKAINYFTQSANLNNSGAQYLLGLIYFEGIYYQKDNYKALHYFLLAAEQNDSDAQSKLGIFYYEGICVPRNISKAIHYLTLSANSNNMEAQYILGRIYINGKYIAQDKNKAIYYYTLSSNNHYSEAQLILGCIYYIGELVPQNLEKAIHFLTLSANNNNSEAQYILGYIYYFGDDIQKDIKKGVYFISLSAKYGYVRGYFSVGFFYHEGKYMNQNIEKSIHYYKEASSLNNIYAKNNLGIIYKNGFGQEISPNYGLAIEYFKEAIKFENNEIAMYNLAHLYLFNKDKVGDKIDQSIKLLIQSSIKGFFISTKLLSLALMTKYKCDYALIKKEMCTYIDESSELFNEIISLIKLNEPYFPDFFNELIEHFRNIDFLFDCKYGVICSKEIVGEKSRDNFIEKHKIPNISRAFYEGFQLDI